MSEYETGTHLRKTDRVMTYLAFVAMVVGTALLYHEYGDEWFSRFMLYGTVIAALPTVWALAAGHYTNKQRRRARKSTTSRSLYAVPPLQDPMYVHKGVYTPLAEALGNEI